MHLPKTPGISWVTCQDSNIRIFCNNDNSSQLSLFMPSNKTTAFILGGVDHMEIYVFSFSSKLGFQELLKANLLWLILEKVIEILTRWKCIILSDDNVFRTTNVGFALCLSCSEPLMQTSRSKWSLTRISSLTTGCVIGIILNNFDE